MAKSIIICGSGNSVPFNEEQFKEIGTGLPVELTSVLSNNYTIGLNSWYKFGCETTALLFCDGKFYKSHYENLKSVPFIVGKTQPELTKPDIVLPNTILLPLSEYYWGMQSWDAKYKQCRRCGYRTLREDTRKVCATCRSYLFYVGFYSGHLVGLFAITFAIALGFTEIYLLGYDSCEVNGKTHFYQNFVPINLDNYGIGKAKVKGQEVYRTGTYNDIGVLNKRWFAPYKDLEDVNIYNVSEQSVINVFPKIDYTTFYAQIGQCSVNLKEAQVEIRNMVLGKINGKT
jgi:hypothetical protein